MSRTTDDPKWNPAPRRPQKKRKSQPFAAPSSHSMRTRAQARTFRLLDLPPEIRNIIYAHAFTHRTELDFSSLTLPASLRVPRLLTEAQPIFFVNTRFIIAVRTNWCVRFSHLHSAGHYRYASTGVVELPRLLRAGGGLPEGVALFRRLRFRVLCCCCDEGMPVAQLDVDIELAGENRVVKDVSGRGIFEDEVVDSLDYLLNDAEDQLDGMRQREGFKGLSVRDVETLAMCFRDESEPDESWLYSQSDF